MDMINGIFLLTLSACSNLFAQIDQFPYIENFDEVEFYSGRQQLPTGWTFENENNDLAFWEIITDESTVEYARTPPNAAHMSYNPVENADDWLFTPQIEMIAGNEYDLSFWFKKVDTGFGTSEKLNVFAGETTQQIKNKTTPIFKNNTISNEQFDQGTASFTPTKSGTYHFGFHCYSEAFQFLLVIDDVKIEEKIHAGVRNIYEENELKLFPNPASNQVYLTLADVESFPRNPMLQIYNVSGRLMGQQQIQSNADPIDVSELPNGWYIVQLIDNNRRVGQCRLLINR